MILLGWFPKTEGSSERLKVKKEIEAIVGDEE
jgi:hypothetical protein